jgi:phenylpropionate dioxygenase-like ring-hydroxylating dioxygenase large terminal subunit
MATESITEVKPSKNAPLLGFWYPACTSSALPSGSMRGVVLAGLPILVCRSRAGAVSAMRDICPHRGMPLSFGRFDGEQVTCAYHGWQFDRGGRCRHIPALVNGSPIQPEKIGLPTYACEDEDGYVWIFLPDETHAGQPIPPVPRLPLPSKPHRMIQIFTLLDCTIDDGIVGLMDPAHGPFVHQSSWWRTQASMHEKAKRFEPIPNGFRMVAHAPSKNSGPYKVLNWIYGGPLTTTIDFVLPNQRFEFVQCGTLFVSTRATVTPITEQQCRIDFCAAWNALPWLPFAKTLFRYFANIFLRQDKQAMERQAVGLRYRPAMMLIDDADTPAKWYYKLKAAHLKSLHTGQPLEHPLKGPVTLRWRS